MPGALWPKKVCIYNINLYRHGKDLLKMLPFDFDSTLIIKIILIARQPIILQYCSCESYILIAFLITWKTPLSFLFTPNMLYIGRKVLFFLTVISRWLQDTIKYNKTTTSVCTENPDHSWCGLFPYLAQNKNNSNSNKNGNFIQVCNLCPYNSLCFMRLQLQHERTILL